MHGWWTPSLFSNHYACFQTTMLAQHNQSLGPPRWRKPTEPHVSSGLFCPKKSLETAGHISQQCLRKRQGRTDSLQQYVCSCQLRGCRVRALIDTEVSQADSWSLDARAAVLGTTWEKFEAVLGALPQLATCDPACLFALRESSELLGVAVPEMLQLVQQVPTILGTPTFALQQNIQTLQDNLLMPEPAAARMLLCDPALIPMSWRSVESQVQRVCRSLEQDEPQQRQQLGEVLSALVPDVLLSDPQQLAQQIQEFAQPLGISPAAAVAVLQAEHRTVGSLPQLVAAAQSVAEEWVAFSQLIGMPQRELMAALVQHLLQPSPRYSLRSCTQLLADVSSLSQASHLPRPVLVCMLLSTPELAAVPSSFWDLLLQYLLFLAPHWRKQLDAMSAAEAAGVISDLFLGADSSDVITMSPDDLGWATVDRDYSRELQVLGALLDHGIPAPVLEASDRIRAGKVWRLIYLCNPHLSNALQCAAAESAAQSSSNGSGSGIPWSWVPLKLLPRHLMQQRQESAMLTCELDMTALAQGSSGSAASEKGECESVEGLQAAASAGTATFCSRHPGYAHWLFNAAFELEWSNHQTAAPLPTWDV